MKPRHHQSAELALLDETMLRDRRRLRRALQRIDMAGKPDALANWRAQVETARARYDLRARSVPQIRVDETLPIALQSEVIVDLIRKHQPKEFSWNSHRLGRVIVLSARIEDSAELEKFLKNEFFDAFP